MLNSVTGANVQNGYRFLITRGAIQLVRFETRRS
jgi:hypothetical protein